ncbi:MAG TPA: PIG-L deacetylase family protein [Candidatus Saccharimonadales bacterium]|nr:PIG-L deacetylase family protein [Candidatus Saccharimonadales bacterium]
MDGLQIGAGVLAVVAHPDDESFGLGAVIIAFSRLGSDTALLCFTHGEASTMNGVDADLYSVRERELRQAAAVLGVSDVRLLRHADSELNRISLEMLRQDVVAMIERSNPDMLLVFDEGGITGHPDHVRATQAALAAARRDLPVVAWAIPEEVAAILNLEFGATFCGRPPSELDFHLPVDRAAQRDAIACHASQASDNPVLWRRIELLGDTEWLRMLNRHGS